MPYCEVQGSLVYYEVEGEGPPMVLVHGAGQDAMSWRFAVPYLAGKFRTIAVDLPGHGKSLRSVNGIISRTEDYALFLNRFIDVLGLGKAILVGHSMSGGCTLLTGLNRPDQILAAVPVDGAGSTLSKAVSYPEGLIDLITVNLRDYWETNFIALCGRRASKEQKKLIAYETLRIPEDVIHGDLRAYVSFDVSDRLAEISFPVVLITGEDDWSCTPENVRKTESLLKCPKELEVLEGVGHFPHMEVPELFSKTLLRLIRSIGIGDG